MKSHDVDGYFVSSSGLVLASSLRHGSKMLYSFVGAWGRLAAPTEIFFWFWQSGRSARTRKRTVLGGLMPSKPPAPVKQKPQVLNMPKTKQ